MLFLFPLLQLIDTATVTVHQTQPVATFAPAVALGAALDGHSQGDVDEIYTSANLRAMRSAGFERVTYRLRTELGNEAWHWNPRGTWSDVSAHRGYWRSDSALGAPIRVSYGYRLPRRGNTIDQANNDGYSRLDDGDLTTYWKSSPYLDRRYTGEPNERHPQWAVVELNHPQRIEAIRIVWGEPYAVRYAVQYWSGEDPVDADVDGVGAWKDFPGGAVDGGRGGDVTLRLAAVPLSVRWLRIRMTEGSHTAIPGARDPRDSLGYAIREIFAGLIDATGRVHDVLRHGTSRTAQSLWRVSSTDPWHREADRDPAVEQPGLDLIFRSPMAGSQPVLFPVGVLYDTPENAAAEVAYLTARHYRLERVELGEEPDGQYVRPEDYAALHVQVAAAVREVNPRIAIGGPSYQSPTAGAMFIWRDSADARSWTARFLTDLRGRGASASLSYLSFEWYPFDEACEPPQPDLLRAPAMLTQAMHNLERDGVTRDIPTMITEYGYSAFAAEPEVTLAGALLNADIVGTFLTLGGERAFLYGTEPSMLNAELWCKGWGDNMLFLADGFRHIRYAMATYHAARMVTREWVLPGVGTHRLYAADVTLRTSDGDAVVTAYPVVRPDSVLSIMLINKDSAHAVTVRLRRDAGGAFDPLLGHATVLSFGKRQYAWQAAGANGHPLRSRGPSRAERQLTADSTVLLPPFSITIVRLGSVP